MPGFSKSSNFTLIVIPGQFENQRPEFFNSILRYRNGDVDGSTLFHVQVYLLAFKCRGRTTAM
jgi:hypothetical protein